MTHDFTKGSLLGPMLRFTIPFILANYLQLTYNAVDSIIVGRFLGPEALAAVGTSNPLMTLLIMLLRGTTLGAGILIGSYFGAKEYDKLHRQISTAMLSGAVFALCLSLIIFVFADPILGLLQVDLSIRPMAAGYLRIIAFGLIFTFLYNYLSSTMQALGDGKTPLIFLAISASVNIVGDLLLVMVFRLGIAGAAIATVASEAVSCALCINYIRKHVPILNMGKAWFVFDAKMLKKTLQYGSVSAIQQATVQLGNGTNTEDGTLQFRSWQLVNALGKIPAERLPDIEGMALVTPTVTGGAATLVDRAVNAIALDGTAVALACRTSVYDELVCHS